MTMNNLDDLAWKREFDRVESKQKKAQPVERTTTMKSEYDVMTSCNKCGSHNNYNAESLDGYTVLEAFTACSVCGFQDYWAYGAFESRLEGFNKSEKYITGQDNDNEINRQHLQAKATLAATESLEIESLESLDEEDDYED